MPGTPLQIIVGLGNPGPEHLLTRHNAGFWFVDALARAQGAQFRAHSRYQGEVCRVTLDGCDVHLLKPQTYMNRSGLSVRSLLDYQKSPPGEMLVEEFLKPLGMSNYRLAKEIGVPAQRIGEIVAGKRAITADTDLRLCRFFGLSDGWWLRLQADFDTEVAKATLAKTLAKIRPWKEAAEQTADAH